MKGSDGVRKTRGVKEGGREGRSVRGSKAGSGSDRRRVKEREVSQHQMEWGGKRGSLRWRGRLRVGKNGR